MTSVAMLEPPTSRPLLTGGFQELGLDQLQTLADEPVRWIVDDLIPEGQPGLLVGPPGVGKSTILTQFALSVAAGVPVLGCNVEGARKVIFVELEDASVVMSQRVTRALKDAQLDEHPELRKHFFMWTPRFGADRRFLALAEALEKRLNDEGRERIRGALLIVDTLSAVSEGDENAAGSSRDLWAAATDLCASFGVTLVLVHHARKPDSRGPSTTGALNLDQIRGSIAQAASARFILSMAPVAKAGIKSRIPRTRLALIKHNAGPAGFYMDLQQDPNSGLWSPAADPSEGEPREGMQAGAAPRSPARPIRERLIEYLVARTNEGTEPSRDEVAHLLFGHADRTATAKLRSALRDLRNRGLVDSDDRPTAAGRAAVTERSPPQPGCPFSGE